MLLLMTDHHLLYKLGFVTAINIVKYNLNTTKNVISEATVCILQKHLFVYAAVHLNCNVIFNLFKRVNQTTSIAFCETMLIYIHCE